MLTYRFFVGFASEYLERVTSTRPGSNGSLTVSVGLPSNTKKTFDKESKSDEKIDTELYAELVKLDTRLGTKASDQLHKCLLHTTRSDIIKV